MIFSPSKRIIVIAQNTLQGITVRCSIMMKSTRILRLFMINLQQKAKEAIHFDPDKKLPFK
jgi:acyl-homoserine lactone acylase PvdQ